MTCTTIVEMHNFKVLPLRMCSMLASSWGMCAYRKGGQYLVPIMFMVFCGLLEIHDCHQTFSPLSADMLHMCSGKTLKLCPQSYTFLKKT